MGVFIAYPDDSRAGRSRFTIALALHRATVHRSWFGPPMQFLVEVEDREEFAASAGTERRPIVTDNAPRARVSPRDKSV